MSSAAVVIGALRVKMTGYCFRGSDFANFISPVYCFYFHPASVSAWGMRRHGCHTLKLYDKHFFM